MFGWRIKQAANEAAAAGHSGHIAADNANALVTKITAVVDKIQGQGYIDFDITLDHPMLKRIGFDGKVKVRLNLPQ